MELEIESTTSSINMSENELSTNTRDEGRYELQNSISLTPSPPTQKTFDRELTQKRVTPTNEYLEVLLARNLYTVNPRGEKV